MQTLAARLASYGSYHRDVRNRRTHLIGVPLITYALLTALALGHLSTPGVRLGLDWLIAALLAAFYLYLDLPLGLALGAILALLALAADATARLGLSATLASIIGGLIVGWALQLLGHRLEGNRPALLDNVQHILIAPIYLTAELSFALGLRRSLQQQVSARLAAAATTDAPVEVPEAVSGSTRSRLS
jgi:uncharacterized membrane protein YGL010W